MSLLEKLTTQRTNSTRKYIELNTNEINIALSEYCARNGVLIPEGIKFDCSGNGAFRFSKAYAHWTVSHQHDGNKTGG